MKCKYRVRWFYSKETFLWIGILLFVVTSMIILLPKNVNKKVIFWIYTLVVLLGCLTFLLGTLTGWLADARFGNYKVASFGIFLMFLGSVFNCLFFVITPFIAYSVFIELSSMFVCAFLSMGGGCCSVSLLQLGLDQMPDASSVLASAVLSHGLYLVLS